MKRRLQAVDKVLKAASIAYAWEHLTDVIGRQCREHINAIDVVMMEELGIFSQVGPIQHICDLRRDWFQRHRES